MPVVPRERLAHASMFAEIALACSEAGCDQETWAPEFIRNLAAERDRLAAELVEARDALGRWDRFADVEAMSRVAIRNLIAAIAVDCGEKQEGETIARSCERAQAAVVELLVRRDQLREVGEALVWLAKDAEFNRHSIRFNFSPQGVPKDRVVHDGTAPSIIAALIRARKESK